MFARRLGSLALASSMACSPPTLTVSADAWTVTFWFLEGSFVASEVTADHASFSHESDAALTFALPKGTLLDRSGGELDPSTPLKAGFDRPSLDAGCQRCMSPLHQPMLIGSGESCGIPDWAEESHVGDLDPSFVRSRARLEWPGSCHCSPPSPASTFEYEFVSPEPGLWPAQEVLLAPDGTMALLGERRLELFEHGRWSKLPEALSGPILASTALGDATFLASISAARESSDRIVHLFQVSREGLLHLDPPIGRPEALRRWGDGVLVAGPRSVGFDLQRQIRYCTPDISRCTLMSFERAFDDSGSPIADGRTEEGISWIIGPRGTLLLLDGEIPSARDVEEGTSTKEPTASYAGTLGGPLGPVRWRGFLTSPLGYRAVSTGNRIIACNNAPTTRVVSISVSKTHVEPGGPIPEPEVAYEGPERCGHFFMDEKGLGLTLETDLRTESVLRFTGPPTIPVEHEVRGTDRPTRERSGVLGRIRLRSSEDGGMFVQTSTESSFRRIAGPDRPYRVDVESAVTLGESVFGFGLGGEALEVSASGEVTLVPLIGSSTTVRFLAAAEDTKTGGALLLSDNAIHRFNPESSQVTELIRLEHRGLDLAQAAPGVHVMVARGGQLALFRDDQLIPLELDWDDPTTSELEVEPPRCRDGVAEPLRRVSAKGGVAWVGTCQDVAFRVDALWDPPIATAVSLHRLPTPLLGDAAGISIGAANAVEALCPDHALFGWDVFTIQDRLDERGLIWELFPTPEGMGTREYPANALNADVAWNSQRAIDIKRVGTDVFWLTDENPQLARLGTKQRVRPFARLRRIAGIGDTVFVLGSGEQVLMGRRK